MTPSADIATVPGPRVAGGTHCRDLSLPAPRRRCRLQLWIRLDERRVFFTSFDRENRHATFPSQDPTQPPFYFYRQHFQVLTREHSSVSIRRLALTIFALSA